MEGGIYWRRWVCTYSYPCRPRAVSLVHGMLSWRTRFSFGKPPGSPGSVHVSQAIITVASRQPLVQNRGSGTDTALDLTVSQCALQI